MKSHHRPHHEPDPDAGVAPQGDVRERTFEIRATDQALEGLAVAFSGKYVDWLTPEIGPETRIFSRRIQ